MTLRARTCTAVLALTSAGIFTLPAAAEEIKFMAELTGAAQVPPVETEAMGMADITVDTEAMTVNWMITHEGLSGEPVAGHFHGPATPEETAPPVIDLGEGAHGATMDLEEEDGTEGAQTEGTDEEVAEDIMEGSAALTEEQLADLQAGRYYVNLHTEQHPEGEIRGQVVESEADMGASQDEASQDATGEEILQEAASPEATGTAIEEQVADVAAGEIIYQESCRNCHGPKAKGMASFPRLTGHDFEYLVTRLGQYHAGETVGPNSALMIDVASELSAEDMANVAAYIVATFE